MQSEPKDPLLAKAEQITGTDLSRLGAELSEIPLPPPATSGGRRKERGGPDLVNENLQKRS